jgi:hypothetical protein
MQAFNEKLRQNMGLPKAGLKFLASYRASLCCRRHMANNSNDRNNLANAFMVERAKNRGQAKACPVFSSSQ